MDLPVTVGVDGSEAGLAAADWAAREALLRDRPLRVLHALPLMPHLLPAGTGAARPGGDLLHEVEHVLAMRHPGLRMRTEQAHDTAAPALLAAGEDADLLVLGARGSGGFPDLRVGSTALQLVTRTGCPTVVLPVEAPGAHPREFVAVGVDARRPAEAALGFAFAAAHRYGLPLRAVHAGAARPVGPGGEAGLLAAALEPWKAARPEVEVLEDVERGGPAGVLVDVSAKARLLVLGRRPVGAAVPLGPVVHAVLHHAACPVAVVPGP
ncbi:universal stress protein [Kitasatospora sp. DSM 101779]|uniref:universal stress protein n=1 Tax=Kitasatospora sp. DSM 101779 TaxID=2853165 RepID=UPI0021DB6138|nr:universal stress protein [Kitasatospora sp. DSM 101779]